MSDKKAGLYHTLATDRAAEMDLALIEAIQKILRLTPLFKAFLYVSTVDSETVMAFAQGATHKDANFDTVGLDALRELINVFDYEKYNFIIASYFDEELFNKPTDELLALVRRLATHETRFPDVPELDVFFDTPHLDKYVQTIMQTGIYNALMTAREKRLKLYGIPAGMIDSYKS